MESDRIQFAQCVYRNFMAGAPTGSPVKMYLQNNPSEASLLIGEISKQADSLAKYISAIGKVNSGKRGIDFDACARIYLPKSMKRLTNLFLYVPEFESPDGEGGVD